MRVTEEALGHLVRYANGDARAALNGLEVAVLTTQPAEDGKIVVTLDVAEESIQKRAIVYDGTGDDHYDTISAFIKSLRGSDPDRPGARPLHQVAVGVQRGHAGQPCRRFARR